MKPRKPTRYDCFDRLLSTAAIMAAGLIVAGLFMPAYPARRPLLIVVISAK